MTTIITVIKGDGIGPSIVEAAIQILNKAGCDFCYEYADAGLVALEKTGQLLPHLTTDAITHNKIVLKGPLTTPIGEGFTSINVSLRQIFALYANVDGFAFNEEYSPLEQRPEIDRWILSSLNTVVKKVNEYMDDYEPTQAGRVIEDFVDEHLSNWYVRLSRRRFWK